METVRIPLHSCKHPGLFALVDEEDAELVNQYRWYPFVRKSTIYVYASAKRDGRKITIQMHRLILGLTDPKQESDHVNHDGLDNRRANLRITTRWTNNLNRRPLPGSSSQYKGVWRDHRGSKWRAAAQIYGKRVQLGTFDHEEDAARAYDRYVRDRAGEHAFLNFPD